MHRRRNRNTRAPDLHRTAVRTPRSSSWGRVAAYRFGHVSSSGGRAKRHPSNPRDDSRLWDAPSGRRNQPACRLHFPETFAACR
ncbi:hypothetical protein MTO96_013511 [Rhipicephalus appendiculatus]